MPPNLQARLYRKRSAGAREEVKLQLLDQEGEPVDLLGEIAPSVVDSWTTLVPDANGWGPFDGQLAQYRKRLDGVVEFRGFVDPGVDGSNMMSTPLATKYRHNHSGTDLYFPCAAQGGEIAIMRVQPNGHIQGAYVNGSSSMTNLPWIDLSGIRYSVD